MDITTTDEHGNQVFQISGRTIRRFSLILAVFAAVTTLTWHIPFQATSVYDTRCDVFKAVDRYENFGSWVIGRAPIYRTQYLDAGVISHGSLFFGKPDGLWLWILPDQIITTHIHRGSLIAPQGNHTMQWADAGVFEQHQHLFVPAGYYLVDGLLQPKRNKRQRHHGEKSSNKKNTSFSGDSEAEDHRLSRSGDDGRSESHL